MQHWAGNFAFMMSLYFALVSSSQFKCPLEATKKLKPVTSSQTLISNIDPICFGGWGGRVQWLLDRI